MRPEKIRLQEASEQPAEGLCHARGTITDVVYLGTVTRYLVAIEGAGSVVVLEQNLDTTSMEALGAQGRAVRLTWQPRHTFAIRDGGEDNDGDGDTMKMRFALGAALAAALALTASATAGTARQDGLLRVTGAGEGTLKAVAWEGYGERPPGRWVKALTAQTGCKTSFKYAGSSDEMVTAMRSGGGYDVVSASGDAIQPPDRVEARRADRHLTIPDWKNFLGALKSPPNNTVDGKHYGVSWLGAERARVEPRQVHDGARPRGRRSTPRPTPARSRCRTTRSRSRTRRST